MRRRGGTELATLSGVAAAGGEDNGEYSNISRSSCNWRRRGLRELAILAGVAAAEGEEEGEN